jgi:hypothetical protein
MVIYSTTNNSCSECIIFVERASHNYYHRIGKTSTFKRRKMSQVVVRELNIGSLLQPQSSLSPSIDLGMSDVSLDIVKDLVKEAELIQQTSCKALCDSTSSFSKLERMRTKNKLLRLASTKRLAESRKSLTESSTSSLRTIAIAVSSDEEGSTVGTLTSRTNSTAFSDHHDSSKQQEIPRQVLIQQEMPRSNNDASKQQQLLLSAALDVDRETLQSELTALRNELKSTRRRMRWSIIMLGIMFVILVMCAGHSSFQVQEQQAKPIQPTTTTSTTTTTTTRSKRKGVSFGFIGKKIGTLRRELLVEKPEIKDTTSFTTKSGIRDAFSIKHDSLGVWLK